MPCGYGGEQAASAARPAGLCRRRSNSRGGARRRVRHCRERRCGSRPVARLDRPDLRLLHLCGEDRREPVAARQAITPLAVYRANAIDAARILRDVDGQRRADPFAPRRRAASPSWSTDRQRRRDRRDQRRRGGRRPATGWAAVEVAETPTDDALLALAARLCNNPDRDERHVARAWLGRAAADRRWCCSSLGAAAATWGSPHYQPAARFLGVAPAPAPRWRPRPVAMTSAAAAARDRLPTSRRPRTQRIAEPRKPRRPGRECDPARGRFGRARRRAGRRLRRAAGDRSRRGARLSREPARVAASAPQHQTAVATIITASHQPVRLDDLITEYEALGPELRRGGPQDSWWTQFPARARLAGRGPPRRPPLATKPDARYDRALQRLNSGDVDQALAETMRLPGASRAGAWVAKARRYIAAHRALDEIESGALLTGAERDRLTGVNKAWQATRGMRICPRCTARVQLRAAKHLQTGEIHGERRRHDVTWRRIGLGLVLIASAQVGASAATQRPRRRRPAEPAPAPPRARRRQRRTISATASTSSAAPSTAASESPSARSTTAGRPAGRPTSSIRSRASANCGYRSPRSMRSTGAGCGSTTRSR